MNPGRAEAAFWAAFARNRNVDAGSAADGAIPVAGGYAVCLTGTELGLVLGAGTTRPLRADDLTVAAAFYAARGLPARFELDEDVAERDAALLASCGYRDDGVALSVYAGTIAAPGGSSAQALLAAAPDDGARITVRTTGDRRAWAALAGRATAGDAPQPATAGVVRRTLEAEADAAHVLTVAAVDGVDAGAGALAVTGEFALLIVAAVLPEYRNRGVHTALIASRLRLGAARGATYGALKAPTGSPAEGAAARCGLVRGARRRRLAPGAA